MPPVRIILIDDDERFHKMISALAEASAELVLLAWGTSGAQAIRLAKKYCPDIILIEVALSEISGIDATKAIRAQCPRSTVVAFTSSLREDDIRAMFDAGASGYISKASPLDDLEYFLRAANSGKVVLSADVAQLLFPSAPTRSHFQDLTT